MKIISFNIRCCDDKDGHSIDERAPRIQQVFDKYDADVLGFQEVTVKWHEILSQYFKDKYIIFNKYRDTRSWGMESALIAFKKDKFKELDRGYFWFSETPWIMSKPETPKDKHLRICQWVKLCEIATEKEFYYMNTHFGFGDEYQFLSVDLLKKTAETFGETAVIITGDFNMTPETEAYGKMTEYFEDFNRLTVNYTGTTFHNYGKSDNIHIDYCFVKPDTVKPLGYTVLDETFEGKYPSDHYGLLFDLEIK